MKTPDEIKKALECHKNGRACYDCPYEQVRTFSVDGVTFGCSHDIVADALAYIEQLESRFEPQNRVLTLEELKVYTGFLWNENRYSPLDYEGEPAFVEESFMYAGDGNVDLRRDISDTYGKYWRCWLRKPTEAERRETPWKS